MNEHQLLDIRGLPREALEIFAVKAAIRIQQDRREKFASDTFLAILCGFLAGALVAAVSFIAGNALS
jgi:hypothetical protein